MGLGAAGVMFMLDLSTRMNVLSLCGVLERLADVAERYRARYEALLAGGDASPRVRGIVEKLELVSSVAGEVAARICRGDPGLTDIHASVNRLADLYTRVVYTEPSLPAIVRSLVYEAYAAAKRLL
ncbi:MAG: hypothetical protein GXO15_06340 [Crenarchaeota archaeon]|nr:hypothetical protein [Thermoproteota archaeon]